MVSGMLVLAHRGANRLAPENTVPAMALAVERGADGVELDVHRAADGSLVVRHDADAVGGPTLAEVLDVCRGRLVNVEIKDPHATDDVVALLAARGDDRVLVTAVVRKHTAVHPYVWTLTTIDVGAFVTRAHEQRVQVNVWTVNDADQL